MSAPITKLLIANRGEIAVRIARTCRELGIATVGFKPADDPSPHLEACDEGRVVHDATGVATYLSADRAIELAGGVVAAYGPPAIAAPRRCGRSRLLLEEDS